MSCLEESASILKRIKLKCPNQITAPKTLWKSQIGSHVGHVCSVIQGNAIVITDVEIAYCQ